MASLQLILLIAEVVSAFAIVAIVAIKVTNYIKRRIGGGH